MMDDEYVYRKSRKRKLELAMAKIFKNVPRRRRKENGSSNSTPN